MAGDEDLKQRIKVVVLDRLGLDLAPEDIHDGTPLVDALDLDSAGVLSTVVTLEEHFDIELDDDELPDVFESIDAMTAAVRSKLG